MRTTLNIDEKLMADAVRLIGEKTKSGAVTTRAAGVRSYSEDSGAASVGGEHRPRRRPWRDGAIGDGRAGDAPVVMADTDIPQFARVTDLRLYSPAS